MVVVVVVVGAGEAAAWAGTITDLTIGFVHLLGNAKVVAMPPIVAIFRIRLRSGPFCFESIFLCSPPDQKIVANIHRSSPRCLLLN